MSINPFTVLRRRKAQAVADAKFKRFIASSTVETTRRKTNKTTKQRPKQTTYTYSKRDLQIKKMLKSEKKRAERKRLKAHINFVREYNKLRDMSEKERIKQRKKIAVYERRAYW
ncbi:MAG TPA: hypothetical protein VMW25_01160 [Clostridia bacterium]|nr:hypothetical protein [Clostridia bacterium]